MLTKITVETALGAELDERLGYASISSHQPITAATATPARG